MNKVLMAGVALLALGCGMAMAQQEKVCVTPVEIEQAFVNPPGPTLEIVDALAGAKAQTFYELANGAGIVSRVLIFMHPLGDEYRFAVVFDVNGCYLGYGVFTKETLERLMLAVHGRAWPSFANLKGDESGWCD